MSEYNVSIIHKQANVCIIIFSIEKKTYIFILFQNQTHLLLQVSIYYTHVDIILVYSVSTNLASNNFTLYSFSCFCASSYDVKPLVLDLWVFKFT